MQLFMSYLKKWAIVLMNSICHSESISSKIRCLPWFMNIKSFSRRINEMAVVSEILIVKSFLRDSELVSFHKCTLNFLRRPSVSRPSYKVIRLPWQWGLPQPRMKEVSPSFVGLIRIFVPRWPRFSTYIHRTPNCGTNRWAGCLKLTTTQESSCSRLHPKHY